MSVHICPRLYTHMYLCMHVSACAFVHVCISICVHDRLPMVGQFASGNAYMAGQAQPWNKTINIYTLNRPSLRLGDKLTHNEVDRQLAVWFGTCEYSQFGAVNAHFHALSSFLLLWEC